MIKDRPEDYSLPHDFDIERERQEVEERRKRMMAMSDEEIERLLAEMRPGHDLSDWRIK